MLGLGIILVANLWGIMLLGFGKVFLFFQELIETSNKNTAINTAVLEELKKLNSTTQPQPTTVGSRMPKQTSVASKKSVPPPAPQKDSPKKIEPAERLSNVLIRALQHGIELGGIPDPVTEEWLSAQELLLKSVEDCEIELRSHKKENQG